MFRFNPQKIDFETKLFNCGNARFYPYQKRMGESTHIVKHIMAHDIDELLLYFKEIAIGSQCDHPNLISVQGYHIEKIQPRGFNIYIKYPQMAETLGGLIEKLARDKKCLAEPEVVKKFYDLSCGLEYLHNKKIVHQNLKSGIAVINEHEKARIGAISVHEPSNYNPIMSGSTVTSYKAPELQTMNPNLRKKRPNNW